MKPFTKTNSQTIEEGHSTLNYSAGQVKKVIPP